MRSLKIILALLVCGSIPASLYAADTPATKTPLSVQLQREPVHFEQPIYSALVSAGNNKFEFIVPDGLHLQGDPASGHLTLVGVTNDSTVTFAVVDPNPPTTKVLSADEYRERVIANRGQGVHMVRESSKGASGGVGPAFDLQWKGANLVTQCQRVVYIPSAAGVLEFTVTASATHFAQAQADLDLVLNTFCYGIDGKPKGVHHLSDKS